MDGAAVAEFETGHSPLRGGVCFRPFQFLSVRTENYAVFNDQVDYFGLLDEEVGLGFEDFAHLDAVKSFVALRAGRPDGGPAGGVEEAELDAGGVGDLAHDSAEGVDLADEMAFRDPADGWIAAHLGDEVEVEGEDGGAKANAC